MCQCDTLGIWVTGEHGGAGARVGLEDLRVLFQPKCFNDYTYNLKDGTNA